MTDSKKQEDNYYVHFKGARLTKTQANIVGLGIIFGAIGAVIVVLLSIASKTMALAIVAVFALLGGVIGMLIWRR